MKKNLLLIWIIAVLGACSSPKTSEGTTEMEPVEVTSDSVVMEMDTMTMEIDTMKTDSL